MKFVLRFLMFFFILANLYSELTVQLIQPANMAVNVSRPTALKWDIAPQSNTPYKFQVLIAVDSLFNFIVMNETTTELAYTAFDLPYDQLLYWRVVAIEPDYGNVISASNIYHFTTDTNNNNSPTLIAPRNYQERVSRSYITFDWESTPNAKAYEIMISPSSTFAHDTSVLFVDKPPYKTNSDFYLNFRTEYYWKVRTVTNINANVFTYSDWSKVNVFRTESKYGPPQLYLPEDSAVFTTNDINYLFRWSASSMNSYFTFSTDSNLFYVSGSILPEGQYYMEKHLNPGKYYWRVHSDVLEYTQGQGAELVHSDWSDTRTIIVLEAPKNYIEPIYPTTFDRVPFDTLIRWTSIPNAIDYEFKMWGSNTGTGIITVTDTTYHATNLISNETYLWGVRAKYLLNGVETYTNWCGYWHFQTIDTTTILAPPNAIYPQDGIFSAAYPDTIAFLWHRIIGANTYRLQIASDSGFTSSIIDTCLSDTTYRKKDFFPDNTTVYWRVKALKMFVDSTVKNGDWSPTHSFTTNYEFMTYPRLISPADNSWNMPEQVLLEWTPIENAVSYSIKITYPEDNWEEFPEYLSSDSNSYLFTYTKTASKYQWIVYGVSANGIHSAVQAAPFTFTTGRFENGACPPLAPLNGTNLESSDVYVEWTEYPEAKYYKFQLAKQSGFVSKILSLQNGIFSENSTIVLDSIIPSNKINLSLTDINQTYFWRVYATLQNYDITVWTNPWQFTVNATNYIESNQANLNIQVYTNNNLLTVKQNEKYFVQAKFELYNISGDMIKDFGIQNFNNASIEFNINDLTSGKYWLKISSDVYTKYFGFSVLK